MTTSCGPFAPLAPAVATVDGRRVEVFDVGRAPEGDPVVVLLTGAGDTARSWLPVQATLAREARVISYERSGIGASDPRPARALDDGVAELHGVLQALAPQSRVLLVGHSFGALLARVYAVRHPGRVAGLVLLDGTPELLHTDPVRRAGYRLYVASIAAMRAVLPGALFERLVQTNLLPYYPGRAPFLRMLDRRARDEWHRAVATLFRGAAVAEMREVLPGAAAATAELGGAPAPLGDLPVALLTSGTYGRGWIALHDAIARRYPNATHALSGDRFHHVHMRHVAATVGLVRSTLVAARQTPGAGGTAPG